MNPVLDHVALVAAIEGPKISVPFCLVIKLEGDFQAAAFLSQAAYLSSLKRKDEGWFDLKKEGDGNLDEGDIFARYGSWQAMLGLKKDAQTTIRKKLKGLGLLEEKLRGVPARLHYRVDSTAYLSFLAQENCQLAKNRQQDGDKPASKNAENSQQGGGDSASYSRKSPREFTNSKTTTTLEKENGVVFDKSVLVYQGAILNAISSLSTREGQQVVDCFVDAVEKKRKIGDVDAWLSSVVRAAEQDSLRTAGADRIAERRRRERLDANAMRQRQASTASQEGLDKVKSVAPGHLKDALRVPQTSAPLRASLADKRG